MIELANSQPALPPSDDAPHLLLVDDDRRIRVLLARYLVGQGYRVTSAAHAAEARARLAVLAFDLLVLDVMMPGESGLDLAKSLRSAAEPLSQIPILMLTARTEPSDRVLGLEAGVDDYLSKPFEPRELSLRIASILRRSAPRPIPEPKGVDALVFGPFTFHCARAELRKDGEMIRLTEREADMLRLLASDAGQPVSRESLGGAGDAANERTIDVQVNRLRRKIEDDPANPLYIQTVRGFGYRLLLDP